MAEYAKRSPAQAAKDLQNYVAQAGADLGSKTKPSPFIKSVQADMGGLTADGIFGPKTKTRAAELLQARSPAEAAEDLQEYVTQPGADLGKKGKPNAFIQAVQRDMGGLTVDGIFGPLTKSRAMELLGYDEPPPVDTQAALTAPAAPVSSPTVANSPPPAPPPPPTPAPQPAYVPEPSPEYTVPPPADLPPVALPPQTQAQVANMSDDVKTVIIEALNNFRNQINADKADYNALISQLSEKFAPNLKAISEQVEVAALQRQATSEHNSLMKADERWLQNSKNQQAIADKLSELVKTLRITSGINKKVWEIYGVHL